MRTLLVPGRDTFAAARPADSHSTEGVGKLSTSRGWPGHEVANRGGHQHPQDEWNLTHYSIRKHGLVGTLKNEFVEVPPLACHAGDLCPACMKAPSRRFPALGPLGERMRQ